MPGVEGGRERRRRRDHSGRGGCTDEPAVRVLEQRAREQARLGEDLEAVAEPQDGAAVVRELGDCFDDGGGCGNRARAEVVAVGRAAGEDDRVKTVQVSRVLVDDVDVEDVLVLRVPFEVVERFQRVNGVLVRGAGECYDGKFHGASTSWIS